MLTLTRKFKGFNINKSNVLLWLEKHFASEDAPDKGREIYAKIKPTDFIFKIIELDSAVSISLVRLVVFASK